MPRRGSRHRLAKNISRDASGFSVRIKVAGSPIEKRFPLDTPFAKVKEWRDDELDRRKALKKAGTPVAGSFAEDAQKYLAAVTAMPEYQQRVRDIELWVALFGERPRHSIASVEIRTARDRWLTVGPKLVQRRLPGAPRATWVEAATPLSASTVNKRLRALENLWTVLDGRKAPNPVREVPEPQEPDSAPRGLSYVVVERILGVMQPSQTRARLKVMAYTGLAQVEIAGLSPSDLDLMRGSVLVRRRRKGRGGKMAAPALHPLTVDGKAAFRDFIRQGCWGAFSVSSMWKRFQAAARRAGYAGLRPYDLRHSYGTAIFRGTKNLGTTQQMLRQRNPITALRYGSAAVPEVVRHAADAFQRQANRERAKGGTKGGTVRKRQ